MRQAPTEPSHEGAKLKTSKGPKRSLPNTLWGFPVSDEVHTTEQRSYHKKRGVALVIAIMVISVMMLFAADLIVASQVNLELSVAHRDNIKAEYLAKSGVNAATLMISADFAYDLAMIQLGMQKELEDTAGDIWSAMNGLPIGGETVEMITQFQEGFDLNQVLDSAVMEQLRLFEGMFVLKVEDEQSKINVNYCAQGRCSETLLMLESLLSCPAEQQFLDRKNVNPKELAYKIKDWVDADSRAEESSGVSDEGDPYANRTPKVRTKNAPFDSLDELRLIDGWDEEIHRVFSPYLTVYPFQEKGTDKHHINLNTAPRALLQCLFPESRGQCAEQSTLALVERQNAGGAALGKSGQKIEDILKSTLCYQGAGSASGEASDRTKWFQKHSMTYSIESRGQVGNREKVVHAVIQRVMPDLKKGDEKATKLLHWKLN